MVVVVVADREVLDDEVVPPLVCGACLTAARRWKNKGEEAAPVKAVVVDKGLARSKLEQGREEVHVAREVRDARVLRNAWPACNKRDTDVRLVGVLLAGAKGPLALLVSVVL